MSKIRIGVEIFISQHIIISNLVRIMPKLRKQIAKTISLVQLLRKFPDDNACIKWLEKVRGMEPPSAISVGKPSESPVR